MLCYSKEGAIGIPVTDVIQRGDVTYANGFGIDAVKLVIQFLKKHKIKSVVDPFVGSGTVVAVANAMGLNAVGVDIDKKQCAKAKVLQIDI
jgi:DNA modification methylase